jgi:hypothetical protein
VSWFAWSKAELIFWKGQNADLWPHLQQDLRFLGVATGRTYVAIRGGVSVAAGGRGTMGLIMFAALVIALVDYSGLKLALACICFPSFSLLVHR